MAVVKNQVLRTLLFSLGVLSLILGLVGAFLPLLPTTPFVLLAAWCFLRSSPKAHRWLFKQPLLGQALRNWETNQSINRPTKVLAASTIFGSLVLIWLKVTVAWVKVPVTLLLLGIALFIVTRREKN